MLALHEGSAVAMAAGHAIARGAPSLALLHSTPGLGNAVAALATARANRAPLVVMVGQQDRRHLALEPFLAGRLHGLAGDYPVWVDQPVRAQDVPGTIVRAYHEAATGRGPAIVIVPMDDWSAPGPEPHEIFGPTRLLRSAAAGAEAVDALADLVATAERPAIVVGAGADGGERWAALVELAERPAARSGRSPSGARPAFRKTIRALPGTCLPGGRGCARCSPPTTASSSWGRAPFANTPTTRGRWSSRAPGSRSSPRIRPRHTAVRRS